MNLRWLQKNLPWQGSYTEAFEHGPKHNHFAHDVLHTSPRRWASSPRPSSRSITGTA